MNVLWAEWLCVRTRYRNGNWVIPHLSSVRPRFSISLVTSVISSFSLWEQTDGKSLFRNSRHVTSWPFTEHLRETLWFIISQLTTDFMNVTQAEASNWNSTRCSRESPSFRTLQFCLLSILCGICSTCSGVSSHYPYPRLHLFSSSTRPSCWPRFIRVYPVLGRHEHSGSESLRFWGGNRWRDRVVRKEWAWIIKGNKQK